MKIFVFNHIIVTSEDGCILIDESKDSHNEPKWFPTLGQACKELIDREGSEERCAIAKALRAIALREDNKNIEKEITRLRNK